MDGIHAFFPRPATPRPRIRRADGIWFEDVDGNRYIDASSGPVVSNLGHGNKRVLAAMAEQAADVAFAFPMQWESDANLRLTERLAALAGPGFERAFLVSGGSEAVETALKFSRQWAVASGQGTRWKVIGREPGYHGGTLGAHGGHRRSGDARALRPDAAADAAGAGAVHLPPAAEPHAGDLRAALRRGARGNASRPRGRRPCWPSSWSRSAGWPPARLVPPDAYFAAVREICTRTACC